MKRNILAALVAMSASALAGAKLTSPVVIQYPNTPNAYAYGALGAAHNSADNTQYIGCDITGIGGFRTMTCSARDSQSNYVACYTQDAAEIDAGSNLTSNSWLYFNLEYDNPTACLQVRVLTSSKYAGF